MAPQSRPVVLNSMGCNPIGSLISGILSIRIFPLQLLKVEKLHREVAMK